MAIARFGLKNQTDLAIEEMSELITALSHWHRNRIKGNAVCSEIADVIIMMRQLALYFGQDEVQAEIDRKLARLGQYLDSGEYVR